MLLFLDLVTSGLLRSELPLGHSSQPWALKIAGELSDAQGNRISAIDMLIKAEGRTVKPQAKNIHGVEERSCEQLGVKQNAVLALISDLAGKALRVVTYGEFDRRIVTSLLTNLEEQTRARKGSFVGRWERPGLEFLNIQDPVCTRECGLLQKEKDTEEAQLRWPTMEEACAHLLPAPVEIDKADAWSGLNATKSLFFELLKRGHFEQTAC
ncbi:hypothetical protein PsAD2_02972 [Pseudovibrio axinellae]|uniref:Uncharacterized protein n=1 Tax=Pseudovibrio axinellae TaxID=989403 RepID=A0A165XEN5_9HYPH|nr:hypothetical protein [Pseudovibrio axinellae]KZL17636.1 hypothetical protein PsAD2_02972 [Pseudovibrio axinellae]SER45458.1 hypothetical protein SAMN05421798_110110 [Pseudovibrio axinellae]